MIRRRKPMRRQSRKRSTNPAEGAKDNGKQLARVRRLCLSLPDAIEKLSHGEPTFFTPKRVFAMFSNNHHNDGHVSLLLPAGPGVQQAVIEEAPDIYYRPPYVGVAGWIGVELSKVDDELLGALIREGHQVIVAKDRKSPEPRSVSRRRRERS